MKRFFVPSLLFIFAAALIPFAYPQPRSAHRSAATDTVRRYIEARLNWADWKEYSQFITWPDEPSWDCYWIAKQHSIGQLSQHSGKVVIPVTYSRIGLFCTDLKFESQTREEVVRYELLRKNGVWKVDGPVPDYPYVDWKVLREWLTKITAGEHESPGRKKLAQVAIDALVKAARTK